MARSVAQRLAEPAEVVGLGEAVDVGADEPPRPELDHPRVPTPPCLVDGQALG